MNDKELLELAAKAAGIKILPFHRGGGFCIVGQRMTWNPLEDDGDALRLAVKLNLIVAPYGTYASVGETHDKPKLSAEGKEFVCWNHETSNDPCAATRRAIVRAAAAIGEKL